MLRRLGSAAIATLALAAAAAPASATSIAAPPPCPAVTPAPPPVEGTEGFVFVAQDCQTAIWGAMITAGVNWGDGTWSPGDFKMGTWIVGGRHVYRQPGAYRVEALLRHRTLADVAVPHTRLVHVADAPRTPAELPDPRFTVGRLGTSQPLVAFDDANKRAFAADYTATIAWGDGSTSRGTVRRDADRRFTILGRHRYAGERHRRIVVTVEGRQGETTTLRTRALVGRVYDAVPKRR